MNVRSLTVTQVRLYPADTFPLLAVAVAATVEGLQRRYGFQGSTPQTTENNLLVGVSWFIGTFEHAGANYIIRHLTIQERRIQFDIDAPSELADAFFTHLAEYLAGVIAGRPDLNRVLWKGDSTASVCECDFELSALFAPAFLEFLEHTYRPALEQPDFRVTTSPNRIGVNASWLPTQDPASPVRIGDKQLQIELRAGTRPADRIFFISSPTDSQTHLALVTDLEGRFTRADIVAAVRPRT